MQPLDMRVALLVISMNERGDQFERGRTEVKELLALLVELGSAPMHCADLCGPVLGERCGRVARLASCMLSLEAACDEANAILVDERGSGHVHGLGRHRPAREARAFPE